MFDWIQQFSNWLIFHVFNISESSHFGISLNFFIFETIKIFILLSVIIFIMGIINAYFPTEKIRHYLKTKKLYGLEYAFASLFGAITPFCSCSSVPLFIGFVQGGIPLGITLSFLITSPLINEVAIALFLSMFGVKTTIIYFSFGILLGMLGGWILGKLKLENLLSDWTKEILQQKIAMEDSYEVEHQSFLERLPDIFQNAIDIIKGVALYILIGVGIGAAVHGYVPKDFFEQYLSSNQWWTVPVAVILGVPMYANAAGIIPVIQVLVSKGVPIGTAIAFMMATVGLSLPEATILRKVMTWKFILIFFGVITFFMLISGFLFNWIM